MMPIRKEENPVVLLGKVFYTWMNNALVLHFCSMGMSNQQIFLTLTLNFSTVRNHLTELPGVFVIISFKFKKIKGAQWVEGMKYVYHNLSKYSVEIKAETQLVSSSECEDVEFSDLTGKYRYRYFKSETY
jgi:hypothetical protein